MARVRASVIELPLGNLEISSQAFECLLDWIMNVQKEWENLAFILPQEDKVLNLQAQLESETKLLQETRNELDSHKAALEPSKVDSPVRSERVDSPMVEDKEGSIDISTNKSSSPSRREAVRASRLKSRLSETRESLGDYEAQIAQIQTQMQTIQQKIRQAHSQAGSPEKGAASDEQSPLDLFTV